VGCNAPVTAGNQTCADPTHQDIERVHKERGQALFQLKERLKRAQVVHPGDSHHDHDESDFAMQVFDEGRDQLFNIYDNNLIIPNDNGQLSDKPAPSIPNVKRVRAHFGRRRTHNEQLIVASCGMILARETFYGAEAVTTVAVSLSGAMKRTYLIKFHRK
jgi:hypothetical protein